MTAENLEEETVNHVIIVGGREEQDMQRKQ